VDVPLGQSQLQWEKLVAITMAPLRQDLGGEQHGVTDSDAGLGPELRELEPPVVEIEGLTGRRQGEIARTDGVGHVMTSKRQDPMA